MSNKEEVTLWINVDKNPARDISTRPHGTCWVEVVNYAKQGKDSKATISMVIMHLKRKVYLVSGNATIEFLPSIPLLAPPSWLPQQGAISQFGDFTIHGLVTDSVPSARGSESQLTQQSFQRLVDECVKFVNNTLKYTEQRRTFKLLGSIFFYNDAVVKAGFMVRKDSKTSNEVVHRVYEIESLLPSGAVIFRNSISGYISGFGAGLKLDDGLRTVPRGPEKPTFPNAYVYSKMDDGL